VIFSFSQAGDLLLSSDWSTLWRLWDTRTGQQLLSLPADGHTLQFSLEDRRLAAHAGNGKVRLFRIAMGREFATLVPRGWPQRHGYYDLTKAPLNDKGRLLALERADADGIALVDLERLEELAVLPVPGEKSVAFESSGESLLTLGRSGLLRWPLHFSGDDSDRLEIGSPKCIDRLPHKDLSISDDGSVLAVNLPEGALIWRPKENRKLTTAGRQADVRSCAVSPDARWVATGSGELLQGAGAKVWDAATGQLVAELPIGRMCCVWFSPDSKWLVTGGGGFRIWEVGTWREGAKLGGIEAFGMACAFTRDGKLIALGDENPGLVRLVEPDSGREVARLAAPVSSRLLPKCFTPDSGKLVCIGRESQALYVFDLRLIRSGLRELGLAWDLEEGAANEPENKLIRPRKPLAVHFEAAIDSLPFADVGGDIEVARAKPSSPEERESLLKKRLPGIRKVADHAQKASWSPEGDRIVCTKSGDVGLEIVNVSTGVKTDLTAPGKDAAWSPGDGRWIAFVKVSGEHEEVWLVDSTGKQPRKLADGGFPSWSGDGKRLFLQSRRTGKLQVIRFLPEPSPPVDVCSMPCEYPAVSWDGESAAYWDKDLLNIVDLKSGTDKRSYGLPFKALALVGWSPDGKQVGLGPFSRTPGMGLYIVNLETGSVVQAAEGEYTRPAWSRDGLRLAFDRRDNGLEEIWTVETKSLAAMKPFEVKTPTVPKPVPSSAHVDRGGS
jgi:WD40 repeat protein